MMLEDLKREVFQANLDLVKYNLVTLTWGNVSGISRSEDLVVIKPSGVEYTEMKPEDMVIVNLLGEVVEGELHPSSDTPTHLEIYKNFTEIGGIAHSHSMYATIFAQACHEIPCLGTTHADHFYGPVPVTRFLTEEEVQSNYEQNTGRIIIECFQNRDANAIPGVLVAGHGPFTWGNNAVDAVRNSLVLDQVAALAIGTLNLDPQKTAIPDYLLNRHYKRKHGSDAYYGQKKGRMTR
jgi:L-ribulose-5-phosphate 4-epimerase